MSEETTATTAESAAPSKIRMPQTVPEKIEAAKAYKEKGNEFFKQGLFSKARTQYATALSFTKSLPGRKETASDPMAQMMMDNHQGEPLSAEVSEDLSDLDAVLKTNISVCFLKLNKPQEALQAAKDALALRPASWKALLRKAEAQVKLKLFDQAATTLDEAERNAPDPGSVVQIKNMRKQIVEGRKQEEKEQKKAFKNIFERAQREEDR